MRDLSGAIPSSVQVVFRVKKCAGKPDDQPPPRIYLQTVRPRGNAAGFAGHPGSKLYHSEIVALWDTSKDEANGGGGGNPTNQDELKSIAETVATAFYDWRSVNYDRVYNGVAAVQPEGFTDEIVVAYGVDAAGRPSATTRLRGRPINGEPEELSHTGSDCCDLQNGVILYQAPLTAIGPGHFAMAKVGLSVTKGHLVACDAGIDDIDACPAAYYGMYSMMTGPYSTMPPPPA